MPSTCNTQAGLQSITSALGTDGASRAAPPTPPGAGVSVKAGWGQEGDQGRQAVPRAPGLASWVGSPISEPWS